MKMGGWINDHLKSEEQTPFNHVMNIDVAKFVYQGAFCNLAYMCFLATCMPQTQLSRLETKNL